MKRRQRQAVILSLMDSLLEKGSWCGEIHIQKATYFLQNLAEVPLDFKFILYKHGPLSFDLRDELTAMYADGLLEFRIQCWPYGSRLVTTQAGKKLETDWPTTIQQYTKSIRYITDNLASYRIAQLEKLAMALYMKMKYPDSVDLLRAKAINELKPYISEEEAINAIRIVDEISSHMEI